MTAGRIRWFLVLGAHCTIDGPQISNYLLGQAGNIAPSDQGLGNILCLPLVRALGNLRLVQDVGNHRLVIGVSLVSLRHLALMTTHRDTASPELIPTWHRPQLRIISTTHAAYHFTDIPSFPLRRCFGGFPCITARFPLVQPILHTKNEPFCSGQ